MDLAPESLPVRLSFEKTCYIVGARDATKPGGYAVDTLVLPGAPSALAAGEQPVRWFYKEYNQETAKRTKTINCVLAPGERTLQRAFTVLARAGAYTEFDDFRARRRGAQEDSPAQSYTDEIQTPSGDVEENSERATTAYTDLDPSGLSPSAHHAARPLAPVISRSAAGMGGYCTWVESSEGDFYCSDVGIYCDLRYTGCWDCDNGCTIRLIEEGWGGTWEGSMLEEECTCEDGYVYDGFDCVPESDDEEDDDSGGGGGGGDGGGTGGGGSSTAAIIAEIAELIDSNAYVLLDSICDQIPSWVALGNHTLPATVSNRLATDPVLQTMHQLTLEGAKGPVVNMDYFAVTVPIANLPGGQSPSAYLEHIRTHINDFIDLATWSTYPGLVGEEQRWLSNNPLGTVHTLALGPTPNMDGSLITSAHDSTNWVFTTIYTPVDGNHPVSGHRQFGATVNGNGTVTYYTRGVDRVTHHLWNLHDLIPFAPNIFDYGGNVWRDFRENLKDILGSSAVMEPIVEHRPNWDAVRRVLHEGQPASTLRKCTADD